LKSIPDYFKIKDYVPYKSPDPLAKNTIAPNWQLISLSGERISLADLKGKLVLIDFFYKGCYPCILAFPSLQALYEKYKDKGLLLLGIDPYDKKEDDIESFLAKHGVTYTVLLGGKDVANDYQVSSYPTIYIVDKNGKIIFTQVGYGKGIETILEKVILENL
jgi:thiol-disulfide isomerase/thioredoxin